MAGRRTAAQRASAPRGGTGAGDDAPWLDDAEQQLFLTFASALVQMPNSLDAQLTRAPDQPLRVPRDGRPLHGSERTLRMSELAEVTDSALSRLSNVATGWRSEAGSVARPTRERPIHAGLADRRRHGHGDRLGTGPREARPPDDSRPPDQNPSTPAARDLPTHPHRGGPRRESPAGPARPPTGAPQLVMPDEHLTTIRGRLNGRRFRRRPRVRLRSLLSQVTTSRVRPRPSRRAAADGGSMGMIRLCTAGLHA